MDECIAGRHDAIALRRSEALSQAKPCQGRTLCERGRGFSVAQWPYAWQMGWWEM